MLVRLNSNYAHLTWPRIGMRMLTSQVIFCFSSVNYYGIKEFYLFFSFDSSGPQNADQAAPKM